MNIAKNCHVWYEAEVSIEPMPTLSDKTGHLTEYLRKIASKSSKGEFYETGGANIYVGGGTIRERSTENSPSYFASVNKFGFTIEDPNNNKSLMEDSKLFIDGIAKYEEFESKKPTIQRIKTRVVIWLGIDKDYGYLHRHVANKMLPIGLSEKLQAVPTDSHSSHFDFYDEEIQKCLRFQVLRPSEQTKITQYTSFNELELAPAALGINLKEFKYALKDEPITYQACSDYIANQWEDSRKTIDHVTSYFLSKRYPW